MPDLYEDFPDEQPEAQVKEPEDTPVQAIRGRLRRVIRDTNAMRAEVAELRKFKAEKTLELRTRAVTQAFSKLGLPTNYAELYPADAEATQDAVEAFSWKLGWLEEAKPEEEQEEQVQEGYSNTFSPIMAGGDAPRKVLTPDELGALAATNPREAARAIDEGRVPGVKGQKSQHYEW